MRVSRATAPTTKYMPGLQFRFARYILIPNQRMELLLYIRFKRVEIHKLDGRRHGVGLIRVTLNFRTRFAANVSWEIFTIPATKFWVNR